MRLNLKRLSVYAALLGVVISSKVLAVGLDDIESKPIERTVFFWAGLGPNAARYPSKISGAKRLYATLP